MKKRSLIPNIVVLAVAIILFFVVVELFFRIFNPQPTYAVKYAPWGWRHIPNVSFVHGAERNKEFVTKVKYNSQGLRDHREFSFEKPANTFRVEVYGDSYAEGVEVPYEKNLCKLLEDKLSANPLTPGARYEVMNFGVYAYDTAQEYLYFKNDGVKYHPDLVIVIYSMDDPQNLQRGFLQLKDGKLEEHLMSVSKKQQAIRLVRGYIKSHFHFLTYLINRMNFMNPGAFVKDGAKIELVHDLPYRNTDEQLKAEINGRYWDLTSAIFKEFKATAAQAGAHLLIASTHIDPVKFKDEIDARKKFCRDNAINFLVSYDFSPEDLKKYHYPVDGHWNEAGHARMADLLFNKIKSDKLL